MESTAPTNPAASVSNEEPGELQALVTDIFMGHWGKNFKNWEHVKALSVYTLIIQKKVIQGLLAASEPMHAEGGQDEEPINQNELPHPQGNLKFLNLQAWSWYYSTDSGK